MIDRFLLNATFPIGFFWRQFFFILLILFSYSKQLFLVEMITSSCKIVLVYVHVNYNQDFYTWTVLKLIYPGYGSLQHWVKKDWSRIIFGDIFLLLCCYSFSFLSRDDNFSRRKLNLQNIILPYFYVSTYFIGFQPHTQMGTLFQPYF